MLIKSIFFVFIFNISFCAENAGNRYVHDLGRKSENSRIVTKRMTYFFWGNFPKYNFSEEEICGNGKLMKVVKLTNVPFQGYFLLFTLGLVLLEIYEFECTD